MKAVYLVFFRLQDEEVIEVGALGDLCFSKGLYVYTGSAMNSVEKRVERHFSDVKNLHWHIDYFSERAEAVDYLVIPEDSSFECVLAGILEDMGEKVEGFGCSDCNCDSHLFRFDLPC